MTQELYELLAPSGAVSRLYAPYGSVCFRNETLRAVAERVFQRVCSDDGVIRPCDMDEFTFCRDKFSRFYPGDIIYAVKIADDPRRLGIRLNRCVTSVAALIEKCFGFCIDVTAAGGDSVAEIAENAFFVLPRYFGPGRLKKIKKYMSGLCECGIVTCDGMISFLKDGEEYLSAPRYEFDDARPCGACEVTDSEDYRRGCLYSFARQAAAVSTAFSDDFPAVKAEYANALAYRLGIAAASARGFRYAKQKYVLTPERKKIYAVPLPLRDGIPDLPAWHYTLNAVNADVRAKHAYYALTAADAPFETVAEETGAEIICERERFATTGYIAVIFQ